MQNEVNSSEAKILSKEIKKYSDLHGQIPIIRSKLFFYILNHPDNKTKFATDIDVGAQTLSRFLEEKRIDFISLVKIRLFVLKMKL